MSAEDNDEINIYKNTWTNQTWNVYIITLNYTSTIENILNENRFPIEIGSHDSQKIIFRNIEHIHGFTDERIIMGVNDISQISNENFHKNIEIRESLIKTECNEVQRHNVDKRCKNLINSAQMICIFGSSIGDTDNYLWKLVGEQIKNGVRLIIFYKGEEIRKRFAQRTARTQRAIKKLFLDKTDLTDEEKKRYDERVYIGVNTNMFDILN